MKFTPSTPKRNMKDIPDVIPFLAQADEGGTEWHLQLSIVRSDGYMASMESTEPFRRPTYR